MHILHLYVKNHDFFQHPGRFWNKFPKTWIKTSLITSSAFVSFAHGSNDGQKGVGLAMLILISLAPAYFAMNPDVDLGVIKNNVDIVQSRFADLDITKVSKKDAATVLEIKDSINYIESVITKTEIPLAERITIRKHILKIQKDYKNIASQEFSLVPQASAA